MRRTRVDSSMLRSVGYDPAEEVLEVAFHHGRIYRYFEVEPEIWQELMEADSIGSYFNANIRGAYPEIRVK